MSKQNLWLIGAGEMAKEYLKVLNDLKVDVLVIGRSEDRTKKLQEEFDCETISGGLESFLNTKPKIPQKAIVTVGIEALSSTTIALLKYGLKDILVEKPGFGNPNEIDEVIDIKKKQSANVLLAYNRRFYKSILELKDRINTDGGLLSFNFEFTEWSHVIEKLDKERVEHENWFYGNSSHIIDTAFFVGGSPQSINSYISGKNELDWHPSGAIYAGSGITDKNVLFNYSANWIAPGRWSMEFLTRKAKYILRPIERLAIQNIGSVQINEIEGVDYSLDEKFKPGLYLQTKAYLNGEFEDFCSIDQQQLAIDKYYKKMSEIS